MNTEFSNPFDEMEEARIQTFFHSHADERIKAKLDNTMGTIRFISNIADVYLSRLVDTVVGITGGDIDASADASELSKRMLPDPKDDPTYPNR